MSFLTWTRSGSSTQTPLMLIHAEMPKKTAKMSSNKLRSLSISFELAFSFCCCRNAEKAVTLRQSPGKQFYWNQTEMTRQLLLLLVLFSSNLHLAMNLQNLESIFIDREAFSRCWTNWFFSKCHQNFPKWVFQWRSFLVKRFFPIFILLIRSHRFRR